jgi:hypothetical protein
MHAKNLMIRRGTTRDSIADYNKQTKQNFFGQKLIKPKGASPARAIALQPLSTDDSTLPKQIQ